MFEKMLLRKLNDILTLATAIPCYYYLNALLLIASMDLIKSQSPEEMTDNSLKFSQGLQNFGTRMYSELAKRNPGKNIIYSPFSIQTCGAMLRLGAEGQTAAELNHGLNLLSEDPVVIAEAYYNILRQYEKSSILKIANKIYVKENYTVQKNFDDLIQQKFYADIKQINFENREEAAKDINTWVEEKTNHLIKNLIAPSSLNRHTQIVLLNAIHFKGTWVHKFPIEFTKEKDFYLDETNTVQMPMMRTKAHFLYGEFDNLNSQALLMPYRDSDLSMLILLPNSRSGLEELEGKLATISLQDLLNSMYSTKVEVELPKFKANFEIELSDVFKNLGVKRIFHGNAELGKMLNSEEPLQVSQIVHKAFIEVNEMGTEAAAATGMLVGLSALPMLPVQPKSFVADRPFYYSIIDSNGMFELFRGKLQKRPCSCLMQ